jgi:hypothetical protein
MARLYDDAQSQYCEVQSALGISGPPFWIAAWVYPDAAANHTVCFLGDKDVAEEHHMLSIIDNGRLWACSISTGDGYAYAETVATVTLNAWNHVMGIWVAEDDRRAYLNGARWVNYTYRSVAGLDRTSAARLGDSTPAGYFSGRIAELAIGTGTPSDAQVASLAKGFDPRLVLPRSSLKALWRLLASDRDLVGENHLTAYNMPSWAEHPALIYPCRRRVTISRGWSPGVEPPYVAVAGRVWQTGAAAGEHYSTGPQAGQLHTGGPVAGQIHG